MFKVTVAIAVVAIGAALWLQFIQRCDIPPHLLNHKPVIVPDIMSKEQGAQLFQLALDMQVYETAINDVKFQKSLTNEHIGEAEKISKDGKCGHPLLVPSVDRSLCILANRVDVGKHFIMAGGVEGLKEEYAGMVSRVQPFMRYMYNISAYPVISELFNSEKFQTAAKDVCPTGKQLLDPFQFNFILQLPGQTVATHIDAPYFWGATRFQFPQWVLACMLFSNLFEEQFVEQVQVVGYFHRWAPSGSSADINSSTSVPISESGEFVYWDTKEAAPRGRLAPVPLSGVAIDGSRTVHAASVYRRQRTIVEGSRQKKEPIPLPVLEISKSSSLVYMKAEEADGVWELRSGGKVLGKYQTDDLRMSVVYRARCFESEDTRQRFLGQLHSSNSSTSLSLEFILSTLKQGLVSRGVYSAGQLEGMGRLQLAITLMNSYIKYPLPAASQAAVPYNYCALGRLMPVVEPLLRPLCKNKHN